MFAPRKTTSAQKCFLVKQTILINFKNFNKMNLSNLNLAELNAQEVKDFNGGGDTFSGTALPERDVERAGKALAYAAHQIGDFFRGVWDGLK